MPKIGLGIGSNSALAAMVAKRLRIPDYHMKAGNRCYDDRVPEEINRRVVDHCSDILLTYTERSRANLLKEGIDGKRIYVTGNPIWEGRGTSRAVRFCVFGAKCVLSDSGTVQEECCLYKIPNVMLRDVTERPETLEAGSNLIAGCEPAAISRAVKTVLSQGWDWEPPLEYIVPNVSRKVVKILLGGTPIIY